MPDRSSRPGGELGVNVKVLTEERLEGIIKLHDLKCTKDKLMHLVGTPVMVSTIIEEAKKA